MNYLLFTSGLITGLLVSQLVRVIAQKWPRSPDISPIDSAYNARRIKSILRHVN